MFPPGGGRGAERTLVLILRCVTRVLSHSHGLRVTITLGTGIDGSRSYSYLVKRMITVCGMCSAFKCHRVMYKSLFLTVSSVKKNSNRKLNKRNKMPISVFYLNNYISESMFKYSVCCTMFVFCVIFL